MSATLRQFAAVNDAAAATTKKLQKQAILADFFRTLDDADLRLAVRFAAGRAFAGTDERVLNVGWSIVSEVVLGMLRLDPREYYDVVVKSGEIGEALAKLWSRFTDESPAAPPRVLTLQHLHDAFEDLSRSGSREHKREVLESLYSRCTDPREAAYLSKVIFGDMRTGVQEGVLHSAIAQAFEVDGKEVQRAQLLVGDFGEVATLAKRRALHEAKFNLFHPIQFMLATPQDSADIAAATMNGRAFFAEDKLDGIRAQVHKSADRVAIYTRTMARTDESFPDVVEAMKQIPGEFLLDGEIVPYRDGVVLPFARIQKRLGRKSLTQKIIRDNPAVFIAFDILFHNGELFMDEPLRTRRSRLNALGLSYTSKETEVSTAEGIDRAFCTARECRNEGLVLKDPDSPYAPGRRGQMWLKIKTHLPTFDCVVTAAETGHGKRRNSLSDYTFAVWDRDPNEPGAKLVNIGKAYSGVTDAEIAQLTEHFTNTTLENFGRVRIVEPRIVMEIACDQIQKSPRHASGYALRFPRIKAIRRDKLPQDADRLSRVIEVYESTANFAKWDQDAPEPEPAPEPTLFDLPHT